MRNLMKMEEISRRDETAVQTPDILRPSSFSNDPQTDQSTNEKDEKPIFPLFETLDRSNKDQEGAGDQKLEPGRYYGNFYRRKRREMVECAGFGSR